MKLRKINAAGLDLLMKLEGFRSTPYPCSAGVRTIGYGHTSAAGCPYVREGMKITKKRGMEILMNDLKPIEYALSELMEQSPDPSAFTDNMFSALACFLFNVGDTNFLGGSIPGLIMRGEIGEIPRFMKMYKNAGGKPILVSRRAKEVDLFLAPDTTK